MLGEKKDKRVVASPQYPFVQSKSAPPAKNHPNHNGKWRLASASWFCAQNVRSKRKFLKFCYDRVLAVVTEAFCIFAAKMLAWTRLDRLGLDTGQGRPGNRRKSNPCQWRFLGISIGAWLKLFGASQKLNSSSNVGGRWSAGWSQESRSDQWEAKVKTDIKQTEVFHYMAFTIQRRGKSKN